MRLWNWNTNPTTEARYVAPSVWPIRLAGHGDVTSVRAVERPDQVEQRALAAPRGTGDGDILALLDAKGDIDEGGDPPVLERAGDVIDDHLGAAVSRTHRALTQ